MATDTQRIAFAQWVLERNLGWIAAAEVKVGVVVAIDTGMLGALAAIYSQAVPEARVFWPMVPALLAFGFLSLSIGFASMAVVPRLDGPKSRIFFGKIIEYKADAYADLVRKQSESELLGDCLAQVHRNAEIAALKFKWVRRSMLCSFFGVAPWVIALASLTRTV